MDPLSDLLRAVRLNGAHFYSVEAVHPWAIFSLPARELLPRVLPDTEHLISYHIVVSGRCWGGLHSEEEILLEAGDAIVFTHGESHYMSSDPKDRGDPNRANGSPRRYLDTVHLGSGPGQRSTLVCGFLGCDDKPFNPLLSALPSCIHVRGATGGWLSEFPRQIVEKSQHVTTGSQTMLTKMAELMFIEVVRRHVETLPPEQKGWLAALQDPIAGAALTLLHERPEHSWTLAELAKEIATSRTVLSQRFSYLVGLPPMQYLTQWRLQLAAEQLAQGSDKVSAVGTRVGYESDAAFSRAFKRATGMAPAEWRRARQVASA